MAAAFSLLSQNDEHYSHCEGCEARKSVFICNAAKRFVDLSVTKSESVTLWKHGTALGSLFSHQFHFLASEEQTPLLPSPQLKPDQKTMQVLTGLLIYTEGVLVPC